MAEAVDALAESKFGAGGIYKDAALFSRIYKGDFGARYLAEAAEYGEDVIACVRDICNYIHPRTDGSRRTRPPSTRPGSGSRRITSRRSTTSASSATG